MYSQPIYVHSGVSTQPIYNNVAPNTSNTLIQQPIMVPVQPFGQPMIQPVQPIMQPYYQPPVYMPPQIYNQPPPLVYNQPSPIYNQPNPIYNQSLNNQSSASLNQIQITGVTPNNQGSNVIKINNSQNSSFCRVCKQQTNSASRKKVGMIALFWAVLLFIVSGFLFFLPFIMDGCKDTQIYCTKCSQRKVKIEATIC